MSDLVVEHITKRYTTPAEDLIVLEDASFSLKQGENAAIIGPSGSGKSTLLHILGALDVPTSGTIRIGGISPLELSPDQLAEFRNQKIGFIFQDHHLLPQLTVLENVLVPALAHGRPKPELVQRARELIPSTERTVRWRERQSGGGSSPNSSTITGVSRRANRQP
jgi:lipoprotein-releasing system ATP-binding protein